MESNFFQIMATTQMKCIFSKAFDDNKLFYETFCRDHRKNNDKHYLVKI